MDEMLWRITHKWIILMLCAFIILPTEDDGVFNSIFLSKATHHHTLKKKAQIADKLAEPVINGIDETANFVRSRCDFLDILIESSVPEHFNRFYTFSQFSLGQDSLSSSLLSDLLLNLPPPLV